MSGFDTDFALIREAVERSCNCAVAAECDCTDDALAAVDRLRVTLTATENALRKIDGRIEFAIECLRSDIDSACRPDTAIEALTHSLTIARAVLAARVVVSADTPEEGT